MYFSTSDAAVSSSATKEGETEALGVAAEAATEEADEACMLVGVPVLPQVAAERVADGADQVWLQE